MADPASGTPRAGPPSRHRGLVLGAAAIVFTRVLALSLVLPGFRTYGQSLTSDSLRIGIALGAYGLTMAVMQWVNGVLSDRFGRRLVLVAGSVLFVAGSAWAAVATSIEGLIAARLVQGLGGVSSAAMAAVGETVDPTRRTQSMAVIGIGAGAGFFLGFILGPVLGPHVGGMPGLFWLTAALGVLAGLVSVRPLPPPRAAASLEEARRGDKASLGLAVTALGLAGFAVNYALSTLAFFLSDVRISHTQLGVALLVALLVMGGASRAIDRRAAAWGPIAACLGALALGLAAFVLGGAAAAGAVALVLVGATVFFAAHATLSAALPSQVSRLAGRSGGRGHGIQLVVAYLGTFVGSVAAGPGAAAPRVAVLVVAALCAAVAGLVGWGLRDAAAAAAKTV